MSRHENSNQFKDGLLMDLHPLQTPNTVLTDNLNGTFITYNGNEYSLQNDMGNFKLKNCRLKPNYFPIGTTSYADTIYIVSYNPVSKSVEIGSYPAPVEYNSVSTNSKKKFWTISESYIKQLNDDNSSNDFTFNVTLSNLNKHKTSLVFSGEDFRLKGGDKFMLKYDQLVTCGFEELEKSVVFDSGKTQNVDYECGEEQDVPWNTPGNIQLSSRIFEIEKIENHVANMFYGANSFQVDLLVDMFVSDKSLIKKIKESPNILEEKDDYIWLKCFATNGTTVISNSNENIFHISSPEDISVVDSETTTSNNPEIITPRAEIISKKITPWLGEFLKISFIVRFVLNYDYETNGNGNYIKNNNEFVPKKQSWNFKFNPVYHTSIGFSNYRDDKTLQSPIKYTGDIVHDELLSTFEHTVDPSNNPYKNIGDKVFKWHKNDDGQWTIETNGSKLSDGKMFYSFYEIPNDWFDDNNDNIIDGYSFTALSWECVNYDNSELCYIFNKPFDENTFYVIFYKGVPYTKIEQLGNEDGDFFFFDVNGNDVSDREAAVYFINKESLKDYTNVTVKPMITYDISGIADERYDNIPFSEFVKQAYTDTLTCDVNGGSLSTTIYTKEDIDKSDSNYIVPKGSESKFHSYFKRYSDNSLDFKSFVELSEAPSGTATFYVYKNPEISNIDIQGRAPDGIFSGYSSDVEYNDTLKKYLLRTNRNIKVWTNVSGTVSIGDSFLFTDHLKYYRIKFRPFFDKSANRKQQFDAYNIDQFGWSDYSTNMCLPNWNESRPSDEGEWVKHKCLDLSNFSAVRMYYPGLGKKHWDEYNQHGMCQMDFSNYDSSHWAGIIQQFNSPKYLPGMCQYISNLHKEVRKDLDLSWEKNKPKPIENPEHAGECSINGFQAAEIMLHSRTNYRVEAERVPFYNDTRSVSITPSWGKWDDDKSPVEWESEQQGVSAHATFISFPVLETMSHSEDWEKWWKVSGCEQHNDPEWSKLGIPMQGIGLSGFAKEYCYGKNRLDNNTNLYACWIPGEENQNKKFTRYAYTSVALGDINGTLSVDVNISMCPARVIPAKIRKLGAIIKSTIPDIKGNVLETDIEYVISGNALQETVKIDLEDLQTLKNNISSIQNNDKNKANTHPIFKMVMMDNPSDRLENHPINGVYPVRSNEQLDANPDVFKSNTGFFAYKNFYVNHEGRVFLTNLNASEDIYVSTNSGKKVFGYFPYLNNCNGWI